jgi:hypothetical protein
VPFQNYGFFISLIFFINLIYFPFFRIFICARSLIAARMKLVSSIRAMLIAIASWLSKGENHVPRHDL